MATTKHILVMETTGKARGGGSKGDVGRVAGLVATALLGLSLLTGGIIGLGRPATAPVAPQASTSVVAAVGTIDFGPVECGAAPCVSVPAAGTIDFGPVECGVAPCVSSPAATEVFDFGPVECGIAPCVSAPTTRSDADQFTYREDHRPR